MNRQVNRSFFSQLRRAASRKAAVPDTPNSGSQADRELHLAPPSGKKLGRLGSSRREEESLEDLGNALHGGVDPEVPAIEQVIRGGAGIAHDRQHRRQQHHHGKAEAQH